ncbi:MAG: hypothetical protein FGM29_02280 [Actinobacteria bacterium]|nr:hypothetical protein [Actinomycetota bacterium]
MIASSVIIGCTSSVEVLCRLHVDSAASAARSAAHAMELHEKSHGRVTFGISDSTSRDSAVYFESLLSDFDSSMQHLRERRLRLPLSDSAEGVEQGVLVRNAILSFDGRELLEPSSSRPVILVGPWALQVFRTLKRTGCDVQRVIGCEVIAIIGDAEVELELGITIARRLLLARAAHSTSRGVMRLLGLDGVTPVSVGLAEGLRGTSATFISRSLLEDSIVIGCVAAVSEQIVRTLGADCSTVLLAHVPAYGVDTIAELARALAEPSSAADFRHATD